MNDKFALTPGPKAYGQVNVLLPFYKPDKIYHLYKLAFALEKEEQEPCFLSDIFYIEAFYFVLLKKQNITGIENKKSQIHVRISQLSAKFAPPNLDLLPSDFKYKFAKTYSFPSILLQISKALLDGKKRFLIHTNDKQLALAITKAFAAKMAYPLVYGDEDRSRRCCALFDHAVGFGGDFGGICFRNGLIAQNGWELVEPVTNM